MKISLDLEPTLLAEAQQRAGIVNQSLEAVIEEALRAYLRTSSRFRLDLPVVRGTSPPAVDVADRSALLDFLDDQP